MRHADGAPPRQAKAQSDSDDEHSQSHEPGNQAVSDEDCSTGPSVNQQSSYASTDISDGDDTVPEQVQLPIAANTSLPQPPALGSDASSAAAEADPAHGPAVELTASLATLGGRFSSLWGHAAAPAWSAAVPSAGEAPPFSASPAGAWGAAAPAALSLFGGSPAAAWAPGHPGIGTLNVADAQPAAPSPGAGDLAQTDTALAAAQAAAEEALHIKPFGLGMSQLGLGDTAAGAGSFTATEPISTPSPTAGLQQPAAFPVWGTGSSLSPTMTSSAAAGAADMQDMPLFGTSGGSGSPSFASVLGHPAPSVPWALGQQRAGPAGQASITPVPASPGVSRFAFAGAGGTGSTQVGSSFQFSGLHAGQEDAPA